MPTKERIREAHSAFDMRYSSLNKSQKEAVDSIEGPVMVIAGPGTGKTSILTLRIANILKKTDTPASGILAITFTDAGVKAMRDKLRDIIGDRAHDVRIHTFHSFASSVIAEYPDHFLHIHGMKQMTDIDQESTIRSIIATTQFSELRPSGKPDAYLSGILRTIDEAKREALSPDDVTVFAMKEIDRIKNDPESISTRGATKGQLKAEAKDAIEKCEKTILFARVYEQYEAKKTEAKKIDFNDLILNLIDAMKKDELLLRLIQERYLYVHIDEHQDTNDAQNLIIEEIADFFETPNIFIVGDEKQAIYRFQGASVENFFKLASKWSDVKVIRLDTNYRSHQGILDSSWAMIEKNYSGDDHMELRIRLKAAKGDRKPIESIVAENSTAMESELLSRLEEASRSPKAPSVAVIVRKNKDLDRVIRLCESRGIPISSERSVDIFNHPVGKLFFDLVSYIVDPTKVEALSSTVIAGMWGLDLAAGSEIVKKLRSGTFNEFEDKLKGLSAIRAGMLSKGPIDEIIFMGQVSGFDKIVERDPSYVSVWRGIVSLAESLTKDEANQDPAVLFRALLDYRASAETRTIKIPIGSPDLPIRAMTAHGSKGLEFDLVLIPYANEESWIGRPRGASFVLPKKRNDTSDSADMRRLFYVALTRAKEHAVILSSLEESDGKVQSPLRFIDELDKECVSNIVLPRKEAETLYQSTSGSLVVSSKTKLLDLAKDSIIRKGLSVTALNHFMDSPERFLEQSILMMPQAPSLSASKGTALHEAFSKVWSAKAKDSKEIEDLIQSTVQEFFSTSPLSKNEKATGLAELTEDIPMIAKALESHFKAHTAGTTIFTETWVETHIKVSINGKQLNIPLHGKLDAVIDDGKMVLIFDYKARKAMSLNAIKGETKGSDGNYWRQLIFYKILASDNPRWKNRSIEPALVFVSPDDKGRCPVVAMPITEVDEDRVKKEIQTLVESVWNGTIVNGVL